MFSESWYAPFWADKWNNKKLVTQEGAYFILVGENFCFYKQRATKLSQWEYNLRPERSVESTAILSGEWT